MTVKELFYAEGQIFLQAQRESYPIEINVLTNNKPLPKKVKVGGELENYLYHFIITIITIILSKNHPLSVLLVEDMSMSKTVFQEDIRPLVLSERLFMLNLLSERCCLIVITANTEGFYRYHPY